MRGGGVNQNKKAQDEGTKARSADTVTAQMRIKVAGRGWRKRRIKKRVSQGHERGYGHGADAHKSGGAWVAEEKNKKAQDEGTKARSADTVTAQMHIRAIGCGVRWALAVMGITV